MKPLYTAAGVFAADQISKTAVRLLLDRGVHHPLFLEFFGLTRHENTGIAFGLFSRIPRAFSLSIFLLLAAIAFFFLLRFYKSIPSERIGQRTGIMLLAGGALGNLTDRLLFGKVTDFLDIARFTPYYRNYWPIFNLADIAILVGTIVIFSALLSGKNGRDSEIREDE